MVKFTSSLPIIVMLVATAGFVAPRVASATGDTLLVHRVQEENSMNLPSRGMSMGQVEQKYGQPTRKLSPRGGDSAKHPTINRWEYPNFIVYFQGSHVIHSVLNTPAGNNMSPTTAN